MKLFTGETVLCPELTDWDVKKYGYIDYIMMFHNEKDDDGKYIDETINGPFIVHHFDMNDGSVTFARVNPDNEYVPDGYAVTITKNILNHMRNVFISANDSNIHLFPNTCTINPEIIEKWSNRKNNGSDSDMYIKYRDPIDNKNRIAYVETMFSRHMIINYHTYGGTPHRTAIYPNSDYRDLDVEIIMW